jgi:acetyltransferase-like isoleucine patch superfamily enzyme
MALSLNTFIWLQRSLNRARWIVYTKLWGMDISPTAVVSLKARLDRTNPRGIHIGEYSYVALGACILAHDMTRRMRAHTRVGSNCFIGAGSILLPGITVGDGSIVAAGAVVTKDVPPASIVAGNPARVIRSGIRTGRFGILIEVDAAAPSADVEFSPAALKTS